MAKRAKNSTYNELAAVFADEDKAREYLEAIRWKDKPFCPHCGNFGAYRIKPKAGSQTRKGVLKCAACRKQFTVTVRTIFESSKIPLNQWLHAIHLMCSSKKGVSANQLSRTLGITYKSAWFLCHRIRKAMERETEGGPKLAGIVEADETYIGGKGTGTSGGPMAGGSKMPVFSLVSRQGDARSFVVDNVKAKTLQGIMQRNIEGSAHIMTDQMHSYWGLNAYFAAHETVDHTRKEYVRGIVGTNFAESYFSLLKRGIIGTFHHLSRRHLQRYLEEFDFRWNSRQATDVERMHKALAGAEGKRLMYRASRAGLQRA